MFTTNRARKEKGKYLGESIYKIDREHKEKKDFVREWEYSGENIYTIHREDDPFYKYIESGVLDLSSCYHHNLKIISPITEEIFKKDYRVKDNRRLVSVECIALENHRTKGGIMIKGGGMIVLKLSDL